MSSYKPARIIDTLRIKPGMDILDIGAGTGVFSFRFAEVLDNTGKVFATDISEEMIAFIKEKAAKFGYKNIYPVLVRSEGVDSFYKERSFDIIFGCYFIRNSYRFKTHARLD